MAGKRYFELCASPIIDNLRVSQAGKRPGRKGIQAGAEVGAGSRSLVTSTQAEDSPVGANSSLRAGAALVARHSRSRATWVAWVA